MRWPKAKSGGLWILIREDVRRIQGCEELEPMLKEKFVFVDKQVEAKTSYGEMCSHKQISLHELREKEWTNDGVKKVCRAQCATPN